MKGESQRREPHPARAVGASEGGGTAQQASPLGPFRRTRRSCKGAGCDSAGCGALNGGASTVVANACGCEHLRSRDSLLSRTAARCGGGSESAATGTLCDRFMLVAEAVDTLALRTVRAELVVLAPVQAGVIACVG